MAGTEIEILKPEVVTSRVPQFIPLEVIESIKANGLSTLEDAKLMKVESREDYDMAMTFRRQIKQHRERIASIADPICDGLFKAHRAACAVRTEMDKSYKAADEVLDTRQKALVEKQRVEQELLKAKQLAETKRLEKERADELAAELEKADEPERAEAVRNAPIVIVEPVVPKLVPEGVRRVWKIKSIDLDKLIDYVQANKKDFSHFLEAAESKIRSYKVDNPKAEIPGVEFEHADSIPVK